MLKVFEDLDIDVVLYDVLGDVVCGGFAVPIREGIAKHVFTVTSSDFMAIYAANNLFAGIQKYSASGGALLGGIIANSISAPYSKSIVDDFAARTSTRVIEYVPRSITVAQAELQGKTVIESAPESAQAKIYMRLAENIANHSDSRTPSPLPVEELHKWASGWATELLKMEKGEVGEAAGGI
jgi:nitrogenase iron protein NifH